MKKRNTNSLFSFDKILLLISLIANLFLIYALLISSNQTNQSYDNQILKQIVSDNKCFENKVCTLEQNQEDLQIEFYSQNNFSLVIYNQSTNLGKPKQISTEEIMESNFPVLDSQTNLPIKQNIKNHTYYKTYLCLVPDDSIVYSCIKASLLR